MKNLIWIVTDGMRQDQLACYGGWGPRTVIDSLAENGVRFNQAIAQGTWSVVSFASFLTALEPYNNGVSSIASKKNKLTVEWIGAPEKIPSLLTGIHTIFDHLVQCGYATCAYTIPILGKDAHYAHWGLMAKDAGRVPHSVVKDLKKLQNGRKPFFMFLRYDEAGLDWIRDKCGPFTTHADICTYLLERLKHEGGDFIKELLREGMHYLNRDCWEPMLEVLKQDTHNDTLIVVSADHGNAYWDRMNIDQPLVMNITHGGNVYEPTIKVPVIMHGTDLPAGKVIDKQIRLIDIVPTVLSLMHVRPLRHPKGIDVDGLDLTPMIIRDENMEVPEAFSNGRGILSLRSEEFKYIDRFRTGESWLYDIRNDSRELFDLRTIHTKEVQYFRNQLSIRIHGVPLAGKQLNVTVNNQKIERELKELGYIKDVEENRAARTLRDAEQRTLGIIMYTANQARFLEPALAQALNATSQLSAHVLVLDNYSSEETDVIMEQHYPEVPYLRINTTMSKGECLNHGVALLPCEYFLIIDPDTSIDTAALKHMVDDMVKNDSVIAYSDMLWLDDVSENIEYESEMNKSSQHNLQKNICSGLLAQCSAFVYRKNIFADAAIFKNIPLFTEWELNTRLTLRYPFGYYPDLAIIKKRRPSGTLTVVGDLITTLTHIQNDASFKGHGQLNTMRQGFILLQLQDAACARGTMGVMYKYFTSFYEKYSKQYQAIASRQLLLQYGTVLMHGVKLRAAFAVFERIKMQYPTYVPAYYYAAYIVRQMRASSEALRCSLELARLPYTLRYHEMQVSGCYHAGRLLLEKGDTDQAKVYLEKCLELEPKHHKAQELLDELYTLMS